MITETQINGLCSEIASAKDKWLSFWVATLIPPVCVRWVQERKNLDAVARYLQRNKIHTVRRVGDTREYLMHGNKLVATFDVTTTRR